MHLNRLVLPLQSSGSKPTQRRGLQEGAQYQDHPFRLGISTPDSPRLRRAKKQQDHHRLAPPPPPAKATVLSLSAAQAGTPPPPGLRKHLHPNNPPMYSHCFFWSMSRGRCQLYAFSSIFGKHSKATADFTPLLLPPVAAFGRGHTMLERPVPVRKSMFRLNYYVLNTHRIHSRLYGLSSRIHHMTLS